MGPVEQEANMKIAIVSAALCITMSPVAIAQQGGYPASPSHGVVGQPSPDGSLRYGNEPAKDAKENANKNTKKEGTQNPDTLGRNDRSTPDEHAAESPSGAGRQRQQ
jgi:hypothetical protein